MSDGLWVIVILAGWILFLSALVKVAIWLSNKAFKSDGFD